MNTMETLISRKSIRSFTGEQISSEKLSLLLKAANAAPAGMAQYDGVHFTIIHNAKLLKKIDDAGATLFGKPDMHPLYGAPTLILVSTKAPAPTRENLAFSNTAIIAHNIVLEAVDLGVGACHIWGAIGALANNQALISKLELTEGFSPEPPPHKNIVTVEFASKLRLSNYLTPFLFHFIEDLYPIFSYHDAIPVKCI